MFSILVKRRHSALSVVILSVLLVFLLHFPSSVQAAIEANGNVEPADPSTWTSDTYAYIGNLFNGTLAVTNDSDIVSNCGHIAQFAFSVATCSVDGSGSTWINSSYLTVGNFGNGTLNITNGGETRNTYGHVGYESGSTGKVIVDETDSTWTNNNDLCIGQSGNGTLEITRGGSVSNYYGHIGYESGSTGEVTVDGTNSSWTNTASLTVGRYGDGTLTISNTGAVSNTYGHIGYYSGSSGKVTVDGSGSTWTNQNNLVVGESGSGTLEIINGGTVSVAGTLIIDQDDNGDGFVNMASGGMLALEGKADGSLTEFFGLIYGTDAIRYWDDSISDWADINDAIPGVDYTLTYLTEGDLSGYTLLTVPEPATLSLLALGGMTVLLRRRS